MNKLTRAQTGVVLILVLITSLTLSFIALSLAARATTQFSGTSDDVFDANAEQVAEAGVEQSLEEINQNSSFAGYASPQEFFNNSKQGYGVFTVSVDSGTSGNEKVITSTGKVYRSPSAAQPVSTRTVKVTIVGTSSGGYSLFTGPGGLILSGVASVVNSSIYVGGSVQMSGTSQMGSLLTPLTIKVANNQCPTGSSPGSTYPQVCSDGTQPIQASGISHIYGSVCATGQTDSSHISGGLTGGDGLEAGCTAPVTAMPTYDRQAQINNVTTTASASDNNYSCGGGIKSVNWPANLQLSGDVSIGSVCHVTVNGDVYITGNLSIGGASSMSVADSVGTTRPHIIVDGTITVGGVSIISPNSSGTGIQFISFKNSTGNPAATVTGTNLYNSQSQTTVSVGGSSILPGMIFDSYWGTVKIGGVSLIGSAIGQTVDLSGTATITFGTSLSSGESTWTIRSYQQVYQ